LARHQCLHASGFDVVEMHKNIGAAIIRQDEAKPPSSRTIIPKAIIG